MKCKKCKKSYVKYEFALGKIICEFCGFCIEDFTPDPGISFEKNKSTKITKSGYLVKNTEFSKSSRFVDYFYINARRKIKQLNNMLKLNLDFEEAAFRLFIFATHRGIVRRQTHITSACCIYVICRYKKTSHLLIDFSDITQICSNKLGTIFLKFIRNMDISLPVIDPSFFIHRFATNLHFENKKNTILKTALRLIARMKRDWISTGRRPSSLCGAALLMSSYIHGTKRSQKEITETVKISKTILQSRLREMDKTEIGNLTIRQLNKGGGGDGKKESLSNNFDFFFSLPPSIKKSKLYSEISIKKINNSRGRKVGFLKIFYTTTKNENITNKKNTLRYLNTNLEIFVKKNMWIMNNSSFLYHQTIVTRAQKEKPFAFFKIKKFYSR